jgi:hypothetical protein
MDQLMNEGAYVSPRRRDGGAKDSVGGHPGALPMQHPGGVDDWRAGGAAGDGVRRPVREASRKAPFAPGPRWVFRRR